MTLINRIKRAVFLDEKVYSEIAEDKDALLQAIIVAYLATVLSRAWLIISSLWFYSVLMLILPLLIWFIETGIMHIVAKLLGGKANFVSYLKAIGFARVPATLGALGNILLFTAWLTGAVWSLACYVTATKVVHRLSPGKAIVVVIVPIILAVPIIWMGIGIYPEPKATGMIQEHIILGLLFFLLLFL